MEFYALVGERLKALHQKDPSRSTTIHGFKSKELKAAQDYAQKHGKELPPSLELSAGELEYFHGLKGYKDRQKAYHAKLDEVLSRVDELLKAQAAATLEEIKAKADVVSWS
ncbi:MAG TPA: hypothetical protein VEY30_00085 [Myxococcaceae bacterium]|nr:hypothetical protein [Myxococcaceae bacterium]